MGVYLGVRLEHWDGLRAGAVHDVMAMLVAALLFGLSRRHDAVTPTLLLAMAQARRVPLGSTVMMVSAVIVPVMIAVVGKDGNTIMMLLTVIVSVFVMVLVCKSRN